MILKLKDRTELVISSQEAEAIQKLLEEGETDFIHIGKVSVSRSLIAGIFEGGLTEADIPNFEEKALEAGTRCRGQYSIQWQIAMIAHDEGGPKGWAKLIRDEAWKEETRKRLRAMQPDGWCDYKAGECACEPEYLSTKARHKPDWVSESKEVK